MKKLHLGCGPVYLDGYVNIDANIPGHYTRLERPDLVDINATTINRYYKNNVTRQDILNGAWHDQQVVCDLMTDDFLELPFPNNSIDEIRLVQVFEHFTYAEGNELIKNWYNLLKVGGILHLDVPDLTETAHLFATARTLVDQQWYARLLFGSQKNNYGLHRSMYSYEMLCALLQQAGFAQISRLPNIHFYPAFAVEAVKI